MNQDQIKAKLLWRCRRGMKELDVLMVRYVEEAYFTVSGNQQKAFDALLLMQDPDLYSLIIGKTKHDDKDVMHVVTTLTEYRQA